MIGVLQVAGCQDATDEDEGPLQPLCPEAGGSVVVSNRTGKAIRDLQIRALDEEAQPVNLLGDQAGLPAGGEVTWADCSAEPQALVITFTDGMVQESELPTLVPDTRRLNLTPGTSPTPEPTPQPKQPPSRQLDTDPIGAPTTGR
jgi:hypothetical protein